MRWIIGVGILLFLIFFQFPELDILISSQFYTEDARFMWREHPIAKFAYHAVFFFSWTISAGLILTLILHLLKSSPFLKHKMAWSDALTKRLKLRQCIFLILALVLGPGLMVHQGFKDHVGRARPENIEVFGGAAVYTPPFVLSDEDGKSFVSGHAAMGFYIASFALLLTGRQRKQMYGLAIALGLVIGLVRIGQGGHYLSDVLFSGVFVLLLTHILHYAMFTPIGRKRRN